MAIGSKTAPAFDMKKESKKTPEAQLLSLLKRVLPKAMPDPKLANLVYDAVEKELFASNRAESFVKFCERVELPDLEEQTVAAVRKQFTDTFADAEVIIKPDPESKSMAVEVSLPDGNQFRSQIKVRPLSPEDSGDPEVVLKFIPFPVCLPGDKELVWMLAKRENITPEEGNIALAKIEEDFWASKVGLKLLRDRVERSFPEFISRVPASQLTDRGLKRHYKTPEAIRVLRRGAAQKS